MVNPDKYIRKAYIDMCKVFMPNTWEAGVPINMTPIPSFYILITNQTRNETEITKGVIDDNGELDMYGAKEWLCTVTVDINRVQPLGNYGSAPVDDLEQQIMNVIENDGLVVEGFVVKSARLVQSQPLVDSSKTQTITRKVFTYEHWLNNID
jgi:hypothetical protein